MKFAVSSVVISLVSLISASAYSPALAWGWGKMVIQDGSGEQVVVKHGLFGNKSTYAQDRLGDKYVNNKGLFGTRDQGIAFLGNSVEKKKGLLGGSDFEASTIFGDRIQSKKSLFTLGSRTTNVNLSGMSNIASQFFGGHKTQVPFVPSVPPGAAGQAGLNEGQPAGHGLVNPDSFSAPANEPGFDPSQTPAQSGSAPFQP